VVRGDLEQEQLFSYVSLEKRVPKHYPLRKVRKLVDEALANLDGLFEQLYADVGRPSIPPERLLRASLLQVFYSIRSERQLMEQLDYNLLFRWFVGLSVDDPVWNPSTFSKNRDRLAQADVGKNVAETEAASDARRRQELRFSRVRCRTARLRSDATRCAECHGSAFRDRWPHHGARRL
jgi:transposase